MSLTDTEQEKMLEWVREKSDHVFSGIDLQSETYFEDYQENNAIEEMDFSNIQQLKTLLESRKNVIHDKNIDLICAVAAFKRKPDVHKMKQQSDMGSEDQILPVFIYNF